MPDGLAAWRIRLGVVAGVAAMERGRRGLVRLSPRRRAVADNTAMTAVDHWIAHAEGRMFAREWPAADAGGGLPPLVLLHDSLGSVELWRDFPALLARDTGRRVIAYDRAGFGRSDARTGRLSFDWPAGDCLPKSGGVQFQRGYGLSLSSRSTLGRLPESRPVMACPAESR